MIRRTVIRRTGTGVAAFALAMMLVVDPASMGWLPSLTARAAEADEDRASNLEDAVEGLSSSTPTASVPLTGEYDVEETAATLRALSTASPVVDEATTAVDATPEPVDLGGMTVTVSPVDETSPEKVRLELLDGKTVEQAGVDGVLFSVAADGPVEQGAELAMSFDYSTFAGANGGDWASRLRMVYIPACSDATGSVADECRLQPLETVNDPAKATLSAQVPVAAAPAAATASLRTMDVSASTSAGTLAVIAGASGSAGDWGATSLAASSSWTQTGSSGGFSWSYPMPVPLPVPGPAPQLTLSYSSSVSDGRVPTSNNQSGWIGEGFDLSTGYVERSYVPCDDDKADWKARGRPNNHDRDSADLCWREDNATLVFQGAATELVKTGANTWVPRADDGTVVTHETSNGDYWKVVTVDGTAYYFGRTKATESGTSGSAWTVPVYGNHPGEPCYATSFSASGCRTVWRWNIDRVVDTLGNEMTYSYVPETNRYVTDYTAGLTRDGTWYTSGGRLASISYGTPASGSLPLGKVEFDSAARCLTTRTDGRALCSTLNPSVADQNWPDTPRDLLCPTAAGCKNYTPVFFNTTRLTEVRARVLDGASYRTSDTWTFSHEYVAQGGSVQDATGLILTLEKVTHTAAGLMPNQAAIKNLPVVFGYSFDANRVDSPTDGHARLVRPRVASILTETRGHISVDYERDPDCTPANKPRNPSVAKQDANTDFCYPVRWNPNGVEKTEVDWFHKYVVRSVIENGTPPTDPDAQGATELVTGSLSKETVYEYDEAGWAKPEGPLLKASDGDLTFSDFRGARTVRERNGSDASVAARTTYFLGLGGSVTGGPDSGVSASDTRREMAGQPYAEVRFAESPTSAEVAKVSETLTVADDVKTIDGVLDGHDASRLARSRSTTYTYRRDGTLAHSTQTATEFDDNAQPVRVHDLGSTATAVDDVCEVTTYAALAGNKVSFPSSVTTRAGDCSTGSVVTRSGATYHPETGRVLTETTAVTDSKTVTDATYTYDARGRVTRVVDAAGNATDTAYTVTATGLLTQVTTTHPDPDGSAGPKTRPVTRAHIDPLSGVTTKTVDANNLATSGTYDAFERLLTVRYPQHASAPVPSVEYAYETKTNGSNVTVTKTIAADGKSQHVSVTIADGLLRTFQTQAESRDTGSSRTATKTARGRLVTHTMYDDAGRVATELGPWLATGDVSRTAIVPETAPPARTDYSYDLAGRVVSERFCVQTACNAGQEKWKTVTHYDGPMTLVVPPKGGVPTASVVDRRGRLVQTAQYVRANTAATTDFAAVVGLPKQMTTYAYDAAGRMTSMVNPAGSEWTYRFDLAGRQTSATDPDSGKTTSTYDDLGRVTTRTDARGKGITYEYDNLGRVTKQFHVGSTTPQATWTYDTAPGPSGTPLVGQLSSSTRLSGGLTYKTQVLGYDAAYRPTGSRTVLPTSTSLHALSGTSYDVSYTYTADGQIASTTLPAVTRPDGAVVMGKERVTTAYDSASMPHWLTGGFGWGTYVAESRFDAEARPVAMDLGNTFGAVVTYDWEIGTGRLAQIALDRERVDGTEIEMGYRYDPAGNVQSIADAPASEAVAAQADTQCFRYDGLRRLTSMWSTGEDQCGAAPTSWSQVGGPAPVWTDFAYDSVGNRTSMTTRSSAGSVVTTSTFGTKTTGPHRLMSQSVTGQAAVSYGWDAAGNRTSRTQGTSTSTYTWDAEGELVATGGAAGAVSNVFDADGARLVRFDRGTVTVFLPGGMEVSSGSVSAVSAVRWYSFAGKTVAVRTGNGLGSVTSVVTDRQGTVVGAVHNTDWVSGVSRRRVDPFGGARGAGGVSVQGRGFLGAPHDGNSLVLLGARFLDPGSGTFVSVDPLLDPQNPAQFHAYVYAGNNPVTWDDRSGLAWTLPVPDGGDHRYTATRSSGTGKKKAASGESSSRSRTGTSYSSVSGVRVPSYAAGGCGHSYNPCGAKPLTPEQRQAASAWLQLALTAVGFVPVVGEIADGLAGLVCLGQGDMVCAGLSVAAMVPGAGWGAGAAKIGKAGGDIAGVGSAGASSRVVLNTSKRLQQKFKHASDFGVSGNYSRARAAEFSGAINSHVNSAATRGIAGTYRGTPVTHHLNPHTGLNVITDGSGRFVSGWRLNTDQLRNVLERGSL